MPRLPGAAPVVGGKLDPGMADTVARQKQFKQQQSMMREQEAGATQRAQIAASAQLGSSRIRAGAQGQATQAGKETAAMQVEASDRRAAERILGQEEDRKFNKEQLERGNEFSTQRIRLEDELSVARLDKNWVHEEELEQNRLDARANEIMFESERATEGAIISLKMAQQYAKSDK